MGSARRDAVRVWGILRLFAVVIVFALPSALLAEDDAGGAPLWTSHDMGLERTGITSLRIHPKAPEVLWAHVHGLGIATSEDEGLTWTPRHEGIHASHLPRPGDVVSIALDPRDEKVLWVVTRGYIYKSDDGGESWVDKSTQAKGVLSSYSWDKSRSEMHIRGVVVDPRKSLRVLAGTRTRGLWRGGLYETTDGGKTWQQIAGSDEKESELGHDAWPIVLDPKTAKNVAVGGSNGFWFSDDYGRHFKRTDPGDIGWHDVRTVTEMSGRGRDLYLGDGRGLWRSRDGGKRFDKKPLLAGDCITAFEDPWNRKRLFVVMRLQGLLVSTDTRHAKWTELGHADAEISEIVAHPRDKNLLYFGSAVTGLHRSTDGGVTLEPVKSNGAPLVPSMAAIAVHPVDVDRAMALSTLGGAYLSADRGATWTWAGRLGMVPTLLHGDPVESATWWAAGRELLRSADHGATWEAVYVPESPEDRILEFERTPDGSLFLLLERSRVIAHSADGGETWKTTKPPQKSPGAWATSFAVDAKNQDHLFLATSSLARLWTPKDEEGGPWESWDGGKTWKALRTGLFEGDKPRRNWNRGSLAAIDPATGVLLYAADGLGLFARVPVDPKAKKSSGPAPEWVEVLPYDRVNAFLMRPETDETSTLFAQAESGNDARTFATASTVDVLARVTPTDEAAAEEGDAAPRLWSDLPDSPARLTSLAVDLHVPGRLLATAGEGSGGVLAYGVPGARPAVEEAAEPVVPPVEVERGPVPPEGLLAFSGGADAQVRIWKLSEGKLLTALPGHSKDVLALALAPDESVLASGGADRQVLLFDGADGSPLTPPIPPDTQNSTVNALVFHPASKVLYGALEQTWGVAEWTVETGETRVFEGHTGGVLCLDVTSDGARLVSGSRDRTIRVWDTSTGTSTLTIDVGTEVLSLLISADGTKVYAGGRGAAVRIFDLATGVEIHKADVQKAFVTGLALTPDGTSLIVAGSAGLVRVDATTLVAHGEQWKGPTKAVYSLAVSRDGAWILAGDEDNGLWLWSAESTEPYWYSTSAHAGSINALVLTPDVAGAEDAPPADGEAEEPADGAAPAEGAGDVPAGG